MTKDKKFESNYEMLLECCNRYNNNLNTFMGIVGQEVSWLEDCVKTYTQGVEGAGRSIKKSRKLIESMLPVVETIIKTEDKSTLLNVVFPHIDAETAYLNYKIQSSICGMYTNMVSSIYLFEKCKADKRCTCNERQDAQEKIQQNENTTKSKYDNVKARYDKVSAKVDIIESAAGSSNSFSNDGK